MRGGYDYGGQAARPLFTAAAEVIANLKRYNMTNCITVKESINKDMLKQYKSEDVLRTGATLKSSDDFWYEVERESLTPSER